MRSAAPVALAPFFVLLASTTFAQARRPTTPVLPPILDTHIHVYRVTRPGGVPWPPPENTTLYRDMTPALYQAAARPLGIVGTGLMEASPAFADNLELVATSRARPRFFRFVVASLDLGAPDFLEKLAELARHPSVVGIRGFLWSPKIELDARQIAHLQALAQRGMTLDLISRGNTNPKARIVELARKIPRLRIIINHLGGARGGTPDPEWVADMKRLAAEPNIHMKLSSFFDLWTPAGGDKQPWQSPLQVEAYRPHFDVIFSAFGADRILWGSNWPVTELSGGLAAQVAIAEAYLADKGRAVRDKIMYRNAERFYRRLPLRTAVRAHPANASPAP